MADAPPAQWNLERRANGNPKDGNAFYLLKGLLLDPKGNAWHGDGAGRFYRRGSRKVRADAFNKAILDQIAADLRSSNFAHELISNAQRARTGSVREEMLKERGAVEQALTEKIDNLSAALGHGLAVRTLLEKIEAAQRDQDRVRAEIVELEREVDEERVLNALTDEHVELLLAEVARNMESIDGEGLRDFLRGLVDRIELDPASLACRLHYAISAARGDSMASPRGFDAFASGDEVRVWERRVAA